MNELDREAERIERKIERLRKPLPIWPYVLALIVAMALIFAVY